MIRRFSDLQAGLAADATLRNMLGLLDQKLETNAKLPLFSYEAAQEGFDDCAQLFDRLAAAERAQIDELVQGLARHLRTADREVRRPARPSPDG